jgi:antitoxin StbD
VASLLDSAEQAVSVTQVSRGAKGIFERLRKGQAERLVVMKNNAPAAVMLSVKAFEALMEEVEDLRLEAVARRRLRTLDRSKTLSHREMMRRFGSAREE